MYGFKNTILPYDLGSPKERVLYEEFLNAPSSPTTFVGNTTITTTGTGAGYSPIQSGTGIDTTRDIGVAEFHTGSTGTGRSGVGTGNNVGFGKLHTGEYWEAICKFMIPVLSTNTDRFQVLGGFINSSTGEGTNTAGISYRDDLNSGKFEFVTIAGGNTTRTDTTVTAAINTWYVYHIKATSGQILCRFGAYNNFADMSGPFTSISDSSAITTSAVGYEFINIIKSVGNTSMAVYSDYFVGYIRNSSR